MPFNNRRIADPPVFQAFAADKFSDLVKELQRMNDRTLLAPITSPEDVMLTDDARTQNDKYRLSTLALRQLCQSVSSGLTALVADISGLRRVRVRTDAVTSIPAAARLYNICVKLRFSMPNGLYNRQMVVDLDKQTVDGILGVGYRYLAHADFVDAVSEAVSSLQVPAAFSNAYLDGRYLSAVWRHPAPLFHAPDGRPVYGGYYITNSEAGECSVGAAVALIGDGLFRALLPVNTSNRTVHAGKGFAKRLAQLIGNMLTAGDTLNETGAEFTRLAGTNLRLVDPKGKIRKSQLRILTDRLAKAGVRREIARDVVLATMAGGGTGQINPNPSAAAAATRTAYDLFVRLSVMANQFPHTVREPMEKAAFEMLAGRIRFD